MQPLAEARLNFHNESSRQSASTFWSVGVGFNFGTTTTMQESTFGKYNLPAPANMHHAKQYSPVKMLTPEEYQEAKAND